MEFQLLYYSIRNKVMFLLTASLGMAMVTHGAGRKTGLPMEIEFRNSDLDRLETDIKFDAGFGRDVVKAFRKRIQAIRAAVDERDLFAIRGNKFEKLKGNRAHQYSMRLNQQWRLILEIKSALPKNIIVVIDIEDYH